MSKSKYYLKTIITIKSSDLTVWEKITNVDINKFHHPFYFKLLNIPQPLSADVLVEGVGGKRVAYFSNKKKFIQEILKWNPTKEYTFKFNPEEKFKVCYFFDLNKGVFQIPEGGYYITKLNHNQVYLELYTVYTINKNLSFLLKYPILIILKLFQLYLLKSIKKNCELKKSEEAN